MENNGRRMDITSEDVSGRINGGSACSVDPTDAVVRACTDGQVIEESACRFLHLACACACLHTCLHACDPRRLGKHGWTHPKMDDYNRDQHRVISTPRVGTCAPLGSQRVMAACVQI